MGVNLPPDREVPRPAPAGRDGGDNGGDYWVVSMTLTPVAILRPLSTLDHASAVFPTKRCSPQNSWSRSDRAPRM